MTGTGAITDWPTRPLIEFLDLSRTVRYGIVQPGKYKHDGVIMLRSQDYSKGWLSDDSAYRVSPAIAATYRNASIRTGDLIMTIVGAGIGQVETAPYWLDGAVLSRSTARIVVDDKIADPKFIRACLESRSVQKQMWNCVKEGAQPVVSCNDIVRFTLPCPPLPEQCAIAAALSNVDELIGTLDKLIAKKRDIKLATMQQLLTGKTRLPGFSGEWLPWKLGDLGRFLKGRGIKRDEVVGEGVGCIRYGELYTRFNNYVSIPISYVPEEVAQTALPIQCGDLLFAGSGETAEEIGKCVAYVGEEDIYAGGDIVVLTSHKQNAVYLGHLLNHRDVAEQKTRYGQGDAVVHISARNLAMVDVTIPLKDEQDAIATILSDMDAEIAALEQRREKTRAIKQGMMQQLLTGKTRLVPPEGTQ